MYYQVIIFSAVFYLLLRIIIVFCKKPVKKIKRLWLPGYKIIYSDVKSKKTKSEVITSKLLISESFGLQGKPDSIYQKNNRIVPVELKSASAGKLGEPRETDVMQLAAYFIIIYEVYGIKPRCGYLVYSDCVFKIKNSSGLTKKLFRTVNEMRKMLATGYGAANDSFITCRHCICRGTVCEWSN